MRFALLSLVVALLAAFAMAAVPHKAVIMSWPNETPDSVVAAAKKAIEDAGGVITVCYSQWNPLIGGTDWHLARVQHHQGVRVPCAGFRFRIRVYHG
jgi:hypothetical protein